MEIDFSGFILLGLLLLIGFVFGLLADKIGLPRVVGYILAGALFSQYLLGQYFDFLKEDMHWGPDTATRLALGIIAFLVGAELEPKKIRKSGNTVLAGAFFQALFCILFMAGGIWAYMEFIQGEADLSLAIILGTIAAATAPAATIAVIDEYKAKGSFTNSVLGIVAIDDAMGIVFFTIAIGFLGKENLSSGLGDAGLEIAGSIVAGIVLGYILGRIGHKIKNDNHRLAPIIAMIIFSIGLASFLHLSYLLTAMVLGFVSKLVSSFGTEKWHKPLGHVEETIFLLFFTVAGSEFVFDVFINSLGFVLSYILLRFAGKYVGALTGAKIAGAKSKIGRNLGLALMPQAGVAIGLALIAKSTPGLQQHGQLILNAVLGSSIFFALTSPLLTRKALQNAGEIKKENV